ncbi:MAG: MATE family efflux transporter [Planctomycetota bacterium]
MKASRTTSHLLAPPLGTSRELVLLAWPVVISYALNNAYRINDQYWIRALGADAQAAIGMTFFVQVLNFALFFLAVGGTMSTVARAVGGGNVERRDSLARHGLSLGLFLGFVLLAFELPLLGHLVDLLGLEAGARDAAYDYLYVILLFSPVMGLFPALDAVYLGRGETRTPMTLQAVAVALNYCLNPILIFGASAAEVDAPGARWLGGVAASLGIEGRGIAGAALATGISRTLVIALGLVLLRWRFHTRLFTFARPRLGRVLEIARVGAPVSFSIAVYGAVYLSLQALVLSELGGAVTAGLGIGFQVFEGLAFPTYLGFAVAGSSLIGRAVGALDAEAAMRVLRQARRAGRVLGVLFTLLFLVASPFVIPLFTRDPAVHAETWIYVATLAFSQYWVPIEAVHEKALMGAGESRPVLWISPIGNGLRVPLAWIAAIGLGFGALGVWWVINLTTLWKAWMYWRLVHRGGWLERAIARERIERQAIQVAPRLDPAPSRS